MSNILFSPYTINGLKIKNRFIRSATFENLSTADGMPTKKLFQTIKDLADGDVGLIISGMAYPSHDSKAMKGQLGMVSQKHSDLWKETLNYVHSKHGNFFFQICHGGSRIQKDVLSDRKPKGVSGLVQIGPKIPEILTNSEIEDIISHFIKSAHLCKDAGADGIQLHAAHGYLLSEFLSPAFNRRSDIWGYTRKDEGNRIIKVISSEIKKEIDKDFPISLKINGSDCLKGGITPKLAALQINKLQHFIDMFEVSSGFANEMVTIRSKIISHEHLCKAMTLFNKSSSHEIKEKEDINQIISNIYKKINTNFPYSEGYNMKYVKEIRKNIPKNIILSVVGGNRHFAQMSAYIMNEYVQFVSMSRPFIRQPHILRTYQDALTEKSDCISCGECFLARSKKELSQITCFYP